MLIYFTHTENKKYFVHKGLNRHTIIETHCMPNGQPPPQFSWENLFLKKHLRLEGNLNL